MLVSLANWLSQHADLKPIFYRGEFLIAFAFIALAWMLRPKSPESNFRVRESELRKPKAKSPRHDNDELAHAKISIKKPLQLGGIKIDGPPHEVLGISESASIQQIQRAHRELMKQYHPDRVGRPDSREWNDAQKIAEAINRARDLMLKKR